MKVNTKDIEWLLENATQYKILKRGESSSTYPIWIEKRHSKKWKIYQL